MEFQILSKSGFTLGMASADTAEDAVLKFRKANGTDGAQCDELFKIGSVIQGFRIILSDPTDARNAH